MNNLIERLKSKLSNAFIKSSVAIPEVEDGGDARLPDCAGAFFQDCENEVQKQLGVSLTGILSSNSTASVMLAEFEKALNTADLSAVKARYGAELDSFFGKFNESLRESACNIK